MLDLAGGENLMIYNGYNNPNIKSFLVENLTSSNAYGFSVVAWNFNGAGKVSDTSVFKSCTAPMDISPPTVLKTTKETISFRWTPPSDDGACPVLSYQIELDDGKGGAFAPVDTSQIEGRAYLREHVVSFPN